MRVGGHRPEPGASFGQEVTGARVAARGGAGPTGHTRLWRRMMTRVALLPAAATLLMFGLTLTGCARSSFPVSQVAENSAGVLLVDLLERAHSATVRLSHAGEHFDGGGGEATNGWSSPHHVAGTDLSFAWADRQATVRLDLRDLGGRRLHIRCRAAPTDAGATQTMTVTVDDVELGVVDLDARRFEVHSFDLSPGAVARESVHVSLAFAYSAPAVVYGGVPELLSMAGNARPDVAAACDYIAITENEPPSSWQTPRLLQGYEVREGRLIQPAGSEAAFALTVPDDARLEYGVRADTGPNNGDTSLRAEVSIRRSGQAEDVFFREALVNGAARWQVDLSSIAGQEVEIVFRIDGGDAAHRSAEWLSPQLYGDPGDMDTATNVVLIVADTLRADHLGSYGGEIRTPNLDALAASGVRFANAYSHAPMTVPSHSSMFTSLLPTEHGVLNNGYVLSDLHVTLPELMRGTGYRHTAAFISLGVLRSHFGIAQGFTEYHQQFRADWWKTAAEINAEVVPWFERTPPAPFFLWAHYSDPHSPYAAPDREFPTVRIRPGQAGPVTYVLNGQQTRFRVNVPPDGLELAFSSVDQPSPSVRIANLRSSDPRIVAVCESPCREIPVGRSSVHYDLQVPGRISLRNPTDSTISTRVALQASDRPSPEEIRRRYREEVEYLDEQIGVLLSALREASRPEDTLIIFTADHGEELFEHGPAGHVPYLYDTVLRVPLFVVWQGRLAAGTVVDEVVSHIDLLPTILEWLRIPDSVARSGRSLSPLVASPPAAFAEEPVVSETFRPEAPVDLKALVASGRKLIFAPADNGVQLFDLASDPEERDDLANRDSATAAYFSQRLGARLAEARQRAIPPERQAITEEEIQRLRALGYLR